MLSNIFGAMGQSNIGNQYNYYSAQQANPNSLQNAYYQQSLATQTAAQQAALLRQQYAQQTAYQQPKWMIDGCAVEFKDFVDIIFPEDTPEKTAFLLKYSGN